MSVKKIEYIYSVNKSIHKKDKLLNDWMVLILSCRPVVYLFLLLLFGFYIVVMGGQFLQMLFIFID